MELQVMVNDEILIRKLKETNLFKNVKSVSDTSELSSGCIIISEDHLTHTELSDLTIEPSQNVFYLLKQSYDESLERSIRVICDSKGITLIPKRFDVDQVIEVITSTFYKSLQDNDKNVITFFSTISNIGTTSTCLSVAKTLKDTTNSKIGVLLLNAWDNGTHQLRYKGEYLDAIKGKLTNRAFNSENEFLSLFHNEDSLYILGGNRYTKLERLYTPDEINYLISLAKEYFNVVLIDAGCHFDNAMMLESLSEGKLRFLVLNQQRKAIEKFIDVYEEILQPLGYKNTDFMTIINDYSDKSYLPNAKQINEELNMLGITNIYNVKDAILTEMEKKTLYEFEESDYQDSINAIVRSIINYASLDTVQEVKNKKRRWFSF